MRVLLTGATGFAGKAILREVLAQGIDVRAAVRRPLTPHPQLEVALIDDLASADWTMLCRDVDAVIHAAAYAHDDRADPAMIFRIKRDATAALAQAAGQRGARFIFLSSIRAQAGVSASEPLRENGPCHPDGPYGEAKLAAETAVRAVCADHAILRLAPLYGPGVKGNLATLYAGARAGWPLPIGDLRGARSLLSVDTLAQLSVELLRGAADLHGTYLAAEPGALTLGGMVAALRAGWGMPARLVPFPAAMLRGLCFALRRPLLWARIGEPLTVDDDLVLRRRCPDLFVASAEGMARWAQQDPR